MIRFLGIRVLMLAGGWLLASALIFGVLRLLPGDVAQVIAGVTASEAEVSAIRAQLGLNAPLYTQYFDWLFGFLRGDLGVSRLSGAPVFSEIAEKMQVTLPLAVLGQLFTVLFALPAGVAAGYYRGVRGVLSGIAAVLAAVPAVWLGLGLIMLFALFFRALPAGGFPVSGWENPWLALRSLLLPSLLIGLIEGAILFRFVRSSTLAAVRAPHLQSEMSYGSTRLSALLRAGLPSVGISAISIFGLQFAGLLSGTVIIERLFALPGLGNMLITDIGARDILKAQSVLLLLVGAILTIGLLMDTVHKLIDPRLRTEVTS